MLPSPVDCARERNVVDQNSTLSPTWCALIPRAGAGEASAGRDRTRPPVVFSLLTSAFRIAVLGGRSSYEGEPGEASRTRRRFRLDWSFVTFPFFRRSAGAPLPASAVSSNFFLRFFFCALRSSSDLTTLVGSFAALAKLLHPLDVRLLKLFPVLEEVLPCLTVRLGSLLLRQLQVLRAQSGTCTSDTSGLVGFVVGVAGCRLPFRGCGGASGSLLPPAPAAVCARLQ